MTKKISLKRERLKQRITLALMAASYAPFLLLATTPDLGNMDAVIRWAAAQTGYAAAIMLLWQFILGTRAVSGLVHRDQIWVLSLHKRLGIFGIALVIAHPLLIMYSYSEDLLFLVFGSLETDFERHIAFGRIALMLYLFVWVTSAILRSKIGYRPWRYIHYVSLGILPFVLLHAPGVGSFYAGDSALRFGWTVMIGIYIVLLLLRIAHFMTFSQNGYTLARKTEAAPGIFMYQLDPVGGRKMAPAPGQFVYVRRSFWSEEHPFSVANYSEKTGRITIATKVFGKYTKKLSEVAEGSKIYLDGPYGVFTGEIRIDTSQPVTCIAGGIGITPFIRHALGENSKNMTLFNANRTKDTVVIRGLLRKSLGSRYIDVFSDEDVRGAERGRIDVELLKKHLGEDFSEQQFYICGPPPMMNGLKQALADAGIAKDRIHTEEFGY